MEKKWCELFGLPVAVNVVRKEGCLLDKSDLSWEHYMIFWQKHMIFWELSSCALSQSFHANPMDCVGNCVWTMASKVREGG